MRSLINMAIHSSYTHSIHQCVWNQRMPMKSDPLKLFWTKSRSSKSLIVCLFLVRKPVKQLGKLLVYKRILTLMWARIAAMPVVLLVARIVYGFQGRNICRSCTNVAGAVVLPKEVNWIKVVELFCNKQMCQNPRQLSSSNRSVYM